MAASVTENSLGNDCNPGAKRKGFSELEREVISSGLCTLCGTCAGICPRQVIEMRIEDHESDEPIPTLAGECTSCGICYSVCPGKNVPLADLDRFVFGREREPLDEPIGIFRKCFKGYGTGRLRTGSSSGGVTLGVVAYALAEGIIDAAVVAVRSKKHPWRATPGIITSAEDAVRGVRSVMEAVPVNAAIHEAVVTRGYSRIGVVGLPCQVHGIRKLQAAAKPKRLADAVVFSIGLFCNSTTYFIGVEHLLKEIGGIESLAEIVGLDYRAGNWPGSMMAMTEEGKFHFIASKSAYGSFFSAANYRRDRCLMCTEFSAELADISMGDIFQTAPDENPRLTAALVRTEIGEELVDGATRKGFIHMEPHDPDLIPGSGYGWEMSKHASTYRLMLRQKHGWPTPDFQYTPAIKILRRSLASSPRG